MSALPFLNSYSGQSTDQLLALEGLYRVDSLVLAFEEALSRRATHTREELTVLAVEALEREVNNGGFHQFFFNSSRQYALVLADSLAAIGCRHTAAIAQRAIEALGVRGDLNVDSIQDAVCNAEEDLQVALRTLDDLYFQGAEEPIADRLFEYIKSNRHNIRANAA